MVLWIFCSTFVSASPLLHKFLHEDASSNSHQCAFTFFEEQQIQASEPVVCFEPPPVAFSFSDASPEKIFQSVSELRQFPGRAPPVS
jgi:hypothetical protein